MLHGLTSHSLQLVKRGRLHSVSERKLQTQPSVNGRMSSSSSGPNVVV